MKGLLLLALGLVRTVILGVRIEAERIVVAVRPHRPSAAARSAAGPASSTTWPTAARPGCGGRWTWRARPAGWSTRPAGCAAPSTAFAPRPSPGRGTTRASRATSRTGWRASRCAARSPRSPSSLASVPRVRQGHSSYGRFRFEVLPVLQMRLYTVPERNEASSRGSCARRTCGSRCACGSRSPRCA